jgi:predicted nucleotidyltransferase
MDNIFFYTNKQKILKCLVDYNKDALTAQTIKSLTKISKSGIYTTLRALISDGLVKSLKNGHILYRANMDHPAVRQFKILGSVSKIYPLIRKISSLSDKIILFGSVSRGEDLLDSDIDLFIISRNKDELNKLINPTNEKIKAIIKTPTETQEFSKKEPMFYSEVIKGIILFDKNDEY